MSVQSTDPYESIATPIQAAPASPAAVAAPVSDDPYASIATPISTAAPQGILSGLISKAKDAWTAGQTKRDSEAAMVTETVEALKRGDFGSAAETLLDHLTHTARSVGQGIGGGFSNDVKTAKENLTGGGPTFDPANPGATPPLGTPIMPLPGEGILPGTSAVRAAGDAFAGAPAEARAVTSRINPFRKMWQGANVSQTPAQAATRTAATTAGAEVGLNTAQPAGLRTLVEEPISAVNGLKKSVYGQVDRAAGTDLKTLYGKLDAINDKIDLEASGSPEESRLEAQRTSQMQTIEDAKQVARGKGVNVDKLLDQGDALHTREMALRDLQKSVFKNVNTVEGNVAAGTPETINVDSAIKSLQKLQDNTKFGAPRLEQALGKSGSKQFLNQMYAAQRAGQNAIPYQTAAKWLAGILGGTGILEGLHVLTGK
jgi:hypothetical protein